ncbi:probable ATP-dependent RNA helicase spindle-E isoform X2 [Aricia agestis]|uniref:probable ATP-dependent RNA helicase spindle-E isoform X2 n=1 Tax=Aricia agestis TaxID=91739 RepID=UPI001C2047E1|nr:probable ATP-dependent RNA helicase spindle-E isoform X2 [Aricia agestis]
MDELRSFFNNPTPSSSQLVRLRAPVTGGHRVSKDDHINDLNRPEEDRHSVTVSGTDYAREVRERETAMYLRNEKEREKFESMSGGLDSMEYLTSIGSSTLNVEKLTEEAMTSVYKKYSFQRKEDTKNLAIHSCQESILDRINSFPVVIIEGPTGCGKTTQVPQWILDDAYNNRKHCKIVVTQPRKIAAISIARRVAQERGWDVGGLVGYQVGLENKTTTDTRISYVTTGVLLQKLVAAKTMNEYTHIILDEVHERGQEMDFLLLVVKKLLYTVSPAVKVVLMSATFDRKSFADYFLIPTPAGLQKSSCFKVTNEKSIFSVKTFYLNHLNKFGSTLQQAMRTDGEAFINPEMYHLVVKLINAFEQIDLQEEYKDRSEADLPSVLIFLPGIHEIEELYNCLTDTSLRTRLVDATCASYKWWVLPLHSTITADEQVRVFQRAAPGHRKIILSTNIAESSITVPDIKYVIDFCLMKVLVADQNTNFTSLQLAWASKTNCEQRSGRAGRVRDGRVYRLVTDKFYDNLPQECAPEIVRCPLERLTLLAKMLDMGEPSDILALAMDPPDLSNIHRTILVLKEMGALKKTVDGEWSNTDGDITYLGRMMAKLPIDVRASKLIMLGYIYGCLEESVIMAAAMSVKSVFSSPFKERLNAYNSKLTWADGSTSDCIALLNVYKVWSHLRRQQHFKQHSTEAQWARRFYVQLRALHELHDLVRELHSRISRDGIDATAYPTPWSKHELPLVLKVILAGAFYPQYFVQGGSDGERERVAVRTLGGLDPRRSVYLAGLPDYQPARLYAPLVRKLVLKLLGDDSRVTVDNNSRKIYVTFEDSKQDTSLDKNKSGDPTIPGQVVLPVYKAIKARQLRIDFRIPLLPVKEANELAESLDEEYVSQVKEHLVPRLPDIDETYIPLKISHYVDVDTFWAQYDFEATAMELQMIENTLNSHRLLAVTQTLEAGDLIAAPYADANGTKMYRARITKILPRDMLEVLYVDYGGAGRVGVCSARSLPPPLRTIPPQAMRCALAGVAPAPLANPVPGRRYTLAACRTFAELVARPGLHAKIYSVAHGVVTVELLADNSKINVNQKLLEKGFAVACEESYDSKLNHDLRQIADNLTLKQKSGYNREQIEQAYNDTRDVKMPNFKDCISDVCLRGPHSPLETTLRNVMYASREKQVHVEWNSVNSVLLDTEPQELYERLLVAGEVGQHEGSNKLNLRHTTMMPNIRGLPAIIALLFCPSAELRRGAGGTRYVSVLCGLGSAGGRPLFPEHDLLVNIDADMSVEDIGNINHIRYLMDYMMYCGDGQDFPSADDKFRSNVPKYIRDDLMKLLTKRRKHREPESVVNEWKWNSVPEHELLEISVPEMAERAVVYPLHAPLDLYPVNIDQLRQLKRDNDQLKALVTRTLTSSGEVSCKLCGTLPMPAHAMRIHLCSNAHKEKEEDLRTVDS